MITMISNKDSLAPVKSPVTTVRLSLIIQTLVYPRYGSCILANIIIFLMTMVMVGWKKTVLLLGI